MLAAPKDKLFILVWIPSAVLGCVAVAWGLVMLPIFWRDQIITATAQRIIRGEGFPIQALTNLSPMVNASEYAPNCDPAGRQSAAIIRLRLAEDFAVSSPGALNVQLSPLRESIRRSLACSPADPFLWLALFWTENHEYGFRPDHLKYLEMSYRTGPNEGWIALRRNSIALSVFEKLPRNLADQAADEFTRILGLGLYQAAIKIFTGSDRSARDALLARLAISRVSASQRRIFADDLYDLGYDVNVPGVPMNHQSP